MTSQPDKFFRDALENLQRPAPIRAWGKIESNIKKSDNKGLWLKIAAGLLLLCIVGFLMWPISGSEKTILVEAKKIKPRENTQKNNSNKVVASSVVDDEKIKSNYTPANEKVTLKEKLPLVAASTESKNEKTTIALESIETPRAVQAVAEINSVETQPSRTIVYTAEEVNANYLRKKTLPEATIETKKTSGIQKLMGLAYELKNTDNGLGDLRQKKNEILALNFLNEDKTKKEKN